MSAKETAEELLRAAGAATPGRWYVLGPPWGDGGFVVAGSDDPHQGTYVCNTDDELMLDEHDGRGSANTVADAKYIAAANPSAVSELARAHLDLLNERKTEADEERKWEAFCHESDVRCMDCGLRYGEQDQYGCVIEGRKHRYNEAELADAREERP